MDSLRIERLRSLYDTQEIELRPITLLVGINSSGKSTLIRSFPLLRQSVETATDSPILWCGNYVDFGSINEAAYDNEVKEGVAFSFQFKIPRRQFSGRYYSRIFQGFDENHRLISAKVRLQVQGMSNPRLQGSYVSNVQVHFGKTKIDISFAEDGIVQLFIVDGLDILKLPEFQKFQPQAASGSHFIPNLTFGLKSKSARRLHYNAFRIDQSSSSKYRFSRFYSSEMAFPYQKYVEMLLEHNSKSKEPKLYSYELFDSIIPGDLFFVRKQLNHFIKYRKIRTLNEQKLTDTVMLNTTTLSKIVLAALTPRIIESLDTYLAYFAASVQYMGPVRAHADRYYRFQDLSLNEIDYQGRNMAMFLKSLSDSETRSFSKLTQKIFGLEVFARPKADHFEIGIKEDRASKEHNIADTGFGYSQLMPIVAQLWSIYGREDLERNSGNFSQTRVVAIEQPELHLHPAMQAKLADLFVATQNDSRARKIPMKYVIETHSEAIINRMGELISEGKVKKSDVQILIFSRTVEESRSEIQIAEYDSKGVLKNWPAGFLNSYAPID